MIPVRDITACDHCGACCQEAPCLLGSYKELRAIEERVGPIRDKIQVEDGPYGWVVRISSAPCVFHKDDRCSIEDLKPSGGRDFKCWEPSTGKKQYKWTANQLRKIGFRP